MARFRTIPKPASQTDEGEKRLQAYWLALGHFVDAFAKVETVMHLALRWHTKTLTDVARAVFSGVRTEEAGRFLRRLADVGAIDPVEWRELEPIIVQLGKINEARNRILHHGAEGIAEGRGFVTNAIRALTKDRIETIPISPGILDAMTYDLRKVLLHMASRHLGRPHLRGQHPEMDEVLQTAWRYIPESPPQKPKAGKGRSPQK